MKKSNSAKIGFCTLVLRLLLAFHDRTGGFVDCKWHRSKKTIDIPRSNPNRTQVRLPFDYREVVKGGNLAQDIRLENHDAVVVP